MLAVFDSFTDTVSQRVLDTDNGQEGHFLRDVLEDGLAWVVFVLGGFSRRPALEIAVN
jgi:hypothetical protein